MIQCPNCRHDEIVGAIFCSQCGAQLEGETAVSPMQVYWQSASRPGGGRAHPGDVSGEEPFHVRLVIMHENIDLSLAGGHEIILGRAVPGESPLPEVDLSSQDAFDNGVSRLHAALRHSDNQMLVTDLGSSNGTFVNGDKVESYSDHRLADGDLLKLGRLEIRIVFQ
jgi:hypothetical protein